MNSWCIYDNGSRSQIYAEVDSFGNPAFGGMHESHEVNGGPYNNILGPVPSTVLTTMKLERPALQCDATGLPERTR